jgi:antitoxin component of RelBE/YafQ-DinJ toxin-antitoxin module
MIQVITITQRSATLPGLVLENIVCCAVGPGTLLRRMSVLPFVAGVCLILGSTASGFAAPSRHNDIIIPEPLFWHLAISVRNISVKSIKRRRFIPPNLYALKLDTEAEMIIQLNVTSDLESQLNKVAKQMGLTPDTYIIRLLQQELQKRTTHGRLSHEETILLQQINTSLSTVEWDHYRALLAKRNNEALTTMEQEDLISLSDQIEEANVCRMRAVAELAQVRNTTIPALVTSLGLFPSHA